MTPEMLNAMLNDEDMRTLVEKLMDAKKKNEALSRHKYKIYEGKDGRWFTRFPKPTGGSVQKAFRSEEDAIKAVVDYYKEETPTVNYIFNEAIEMKYEEGSISAPTRERAMTDFKRFFSSIADRKIDSFTADEVESFLRKQKIDHDLSAKGYSHLLSVARTIFRYAKRKKLIIFRIDDVIADMDWGKNAFRKEEIDDSDEVFSDEEVMKLAEYFRSNPNEKHLGLLLCFATGLRIGELAALKWDDLGDNYIFIRRTERTWTENHKTHCEVVKLTKSKAGKRIVPIPEQADWIIEELRRNTTSDDIIFATKGKRVRAVYFRKALYKACDMVGIKRRSPHKIRKTYASILLDNNVPEKMITENMGHTDISVTNSKYARRRKTMNERVSLVSDILEFDLVAGCSNENGKDG